MTDVIFAIDFLSATVALTRLLSATAVFELVTLLVYPVVLDVSMDFFKSLYARVKKVLKFPRIFKFARRCFHSRDFSLNSPNFWIV